MAYDLNSALRGLAQGFQNKQKMDDFNRLYSASPEFAQGYYNTLNQNKRSDLMEQQQQAEVDRQQALRNLSGQIGSSGDVENALARYAEITGDPRELLDYMQKKEAASNLGMSGGATGALIQNLMNENPGMSFSDALAQIQTGYRKGVAFKDGRAVPIEGFGQALGNIGGQEQYGKKTGELEARLGLEPQVEASVATAKSDAEYMAQGRQSLPKIQRTLQAQELKEEFLNPKIDDLMNRASNLTTGWAGSLASSIPGTSAYDLKADVDTLLANAGFDRLQEMRDNSVTGGALGQVSEVELGLLQAAAQNLQNSQSLEQFKANLAAFKQQRARTIKNMREAYQQDYERFGGKADSALPAPTSGIVEFSAEEFLSQ